MRDRLIATLAGAGVPVDTVSATPPFAVTYRPFATAEQVALGDSMLAAFDYSEETQAAWEVARRREAAKQVITSPDPVLVAVRNGLYALMVSLQECRAKVNELVAKSNAEGGAQIDLLVTGDTFQQAIETVQTIIDLGVIE